MSDTDLSRDKVCPSCGGPISDGQSICDSCSLLDDCSDGKLSVTIGLDLETETVKGDVVDIDGVRAIYRIGQREDSDFIPMGVSAGGRWDQEEELVMDTFTKMVLSYGEDLALDKMFEELSDRYSVQEIDEIIGRINNKLGFDKDADETPDA